MMRNTLPPLASNDLFGCAYDSTGSSFRLANDPSSATRPTRRHDCNSDAMAGFAAAHG
jgi:hypothetical protein